MPLLGGHEIFTLSRNAQPESGRDGAIAGDLGTDGPWREHIERLSLDCCIHLAWDGLPDYSLGRCRANLDANVALLETLVRARVRRVVVAGTCWEYGAVSGPADEARAPGDRGTFAATKHAIRTMLESVARDAGMEYRWARIFFAYGPGQRDAALIPHLRRAFRAGEAPSLREPGAVNDFVHVDDVARGLQLLAECDAPSGAFNLGSGSPTSVGDVANLVAAHYGQPAAFGASQSQSGMWADMQKTEAATGWRPQIGIADGVQRTLVAMDEAA